MGFKLVVFDLDGTLADTGRDLADSVNELRRALNLRPVAAVRVAANVGQGVHHLLAQVMPEVPASRHGPLGKRFQAIYARRCVHRTRLFPGARTALKQLGGVRMAVATNKPGRISRRILRRLGVLPRFAAVIGGDEMRRRKPYPDVLQDLMRRFRARPAETLMVGDSRFDMECGRRARCRLCAVTWGFGSRAELARWRPDYTIRRFSTLRRIAAS